MGRWWCWDVSFVMMGRLFDFMSAWFCMIWMC